MTELWLVRHGQTDWNLQGRWQGQANDAPGLNDTGFAQALALLDQLPDVNFSAIYSSDLLRARQTAELVAKPLGLTITLEPRLREINLGDWEGMLSDDIQAHYPRELEERQHDPFNTRAPKGEAPREVAERILAVVNEIALKYPNESVLLISHGLALAVIICLAEEIPMDQVYEHIPDNAKPVYVKWQGKTNPVSKTL